MGDMDDMINEEDPHYYVQEDGEVAGHEPVYLYSCGEAVVDTTLAWLVPVGERLMWFPKSRCVLKGGTITVPRWLAIRKGMMEMPEKVGEV